MSEVDSGYQLSVVKGEDRGRNIPLESREIHMGRKSSGTPQPHWIYFAEPTVSRHHATLVWDPARHAYTIYHKSHTNPTLVNGKRVVHCPLGHDDVVQIGLLVFRMVEVGPRAVAAPEPEPEPEMSGPAPYDEPDDELEEMGAEPDNEVQTGLRLSVLDGPDRGRVFPMRGTVLFVGRRDGTSDRRSGGILLNDDDIPKEQILLAWNEREQSYGIFQIESSNVPTRVVRVDQGEQRSVLLGPAMQLLLQPDDVIKFGQSILRLELEAYADSMGASPRETLQAIERIPRREDAERSARRNDPERFPWHEETEDEGPATDDLRRHEAPSSIPRARSAPIAEPSEAPSEPASGGWEPNPSDSGRRLVRRPGPFAEEEPPVSLIGRRRREVRPERRDTEPIDETPDEPSSLFSSDDDRPASLFSSDDGGAASLFSSGDILPPSRPVVEPPEAPRVTPRPIPRSATGEDRPVLPAEPERAAEGAPTGPKTPEPTGLPLEGLHFPTLDVNLVRNLPTRAVPDASATGSMERPLGATMQRVPPGTGATPAPPTVRPTPPVPRPAPEQASPATRPPAQSSPPTRPPAQAPAPPQAPVQASPTARPSAPPPLTARPSAPLPPTARPSAPMPPPVAPAASSTVPPPTAPAGPPASSLAPNLRVPSRPGRADEADTVSRISPKRRAHASIDDSGNNDIDDVESLDFKDSTFAWRYRADYVLGFLEGPNRGQKIELLTRQLEDGRQITLGAQGERLNDIEIDDPSVANVQGTITYASGRFTLLNEGEDGQIAINQMSVGRNEEMPLKTGDRIAMGESVLIFLERAVVQVLSRFEVVVLNGIPEDQGRSFDLLRESVVIGRHRTCEIALADPEVSRKHLSITLRNGRFYLSHMSTSNPTFINGISLPRGRDRLLNDGDKIQVSDHTTLQFRERAPRK